MKGIKYPIGIKLVLIITLLLAVSLGAITFLVSYMVTSDIRVTAEDNNFLVNTRSAEAVRNVLDRERTSALVLLETLALSSGESGLSQQLLGQAASLYFGKSPKTLALVLSGAPQGDIVLCNEAFFRGRGLDTALCESWTKPGGSAYSRDRIARSAAGELFLLNASPVTGVPSLVMLMPWNMNGNPAVAALVFSTEDLSDTFGSAANQSFMVNGDGDLLVSPDEALLKTGANVADLSIVKTLRESTQRNLQTIYTDKAGKRNFGAFQKIDMANASVVTSIPWDVVFEGIVSTTRRNILLAGTVMFISIILIWFFSKTISGPLRALAAAAGRIEAGEFEIDMKAKTRDEVGYLTDSFVRMGAGLAERERLKDSFGRFINKEIAERAMRGELSLGGETKQVTIFFSDIRSFTAISEKLEPHEVVEFLNEYMTAMVECVDKTGGVVDKFIGDSIMAVWGAPVSTGSPAKDALSCVKAALMMRAALLKFNKGRGGDKKPLIRIGCGINTGAVVAGQIGSSKRMEYTVIGDSVNLASRTEALNKPLATDILITENTWRLVGKYLITEEMPPVTVKGKSKPIRMFAVVNVKPRDGSAGVPSTLGELRKILGLKAPDLAAVDVNEEEHKYAISAKKAK